MKKFSGFGNGTGNDAPKAKSKLSTYKETPRAKSKLSTYREAEAKSRIKQPKIATGKIEKLKPLNTKTVGKALGKIAKKVGSRLLGPVGFGLTAYDIAKTTPKIVKATKESLKKEFKQRKSSKATDLFRGPKY